jgi:DNA helicase II / ATP-dependent DNA helicase PcrA
LYGKKIRILAHQQNYTATFMDSLKTLNEAQQTAVRETEGPVLVLAGPGTGKTHILASRIGNILIETDAQAHNILCLTFTDAGATAMRQRLLKFIGPDAHKVHIFTYHAFCNHIIKSNAEFFRKNDLDLISDLEKITFIRELLNDLPSEHVLIEGRSDYFYEEHLIDIFDKIKKENWKIDHVNAMIDAYVKNLPEREDLKYVRGEKKGTIKQEAYDKEVASMSRLKAGVAIFPLYEKKLQDANRYDYADMISWVIKAFKENENLLRNYQEQYLYFLVDEFQDTNGAQYHILKTLIEYWENPNVFIVGDDDQAIYEFQGARIQSFTDFYQKYINDLSVVVLTENYRSTQPILDASKALIDHNRLRITNEIQNTDKNLIASGENAKKSILKPIVTAYPNPLHELADIVDFLQKAFENGEKMSDYAVLYTKHSQADDFINLFEKSGIPYNTQRPIDILQTAVIQQLITILQYIDAEVQKPFSGNSLLFKILYFRCWNISSLSIAKLSLALQKEEQLSWREALRNHEFLHQNEIKDAEKVSDLLTFLEECIESIYEINTPQLVEKIINRSGILGQVLQSDYVTQDLQVLQTFLSFVSDENSKSSLFSLEKLTDTLEKMQKNRIRMALHRNIENAEGVIFSTVHSAKGLEYKTVFLIDNNEKNWEKRRNDARGEFALPDTLTLTKAEDEIESQRRLFYVAMTRAKENLYLSFSQNNNSEKANQQSIFIDELLASNTVDFVEKVVSKSIVQRISALSLSNQSIVLPAVKLGIIEKKLENFVLSASSLITYLDCPLSFYFENILNVPSQSSEFASYGNVLHKTLQNFFNKSLFYNKKKLLPKEELFIFFEREMKARRFEFSSRSYENRTQMGKKNLDLYYDKEILKWNLNGQSEVYISKTTINDVPVKGVIDKVIFLEDGSVQLVDYKTGKWDSKKVSKSKNDELIGGDFRLQMLFYKLLYENWKNSAKAVSDMSINYLTPDQREDFKKNSLDFEQDEIHKMNVLIKNTYEKIMNQDFYKGCGKKDCQWCEFTRTHVLPSSTWNEKKAELDDL